MTMIWRQFAAEERARNFKLRAVQGAFDFPFRQQRQEARFVLSPAAFALLVVVEHGLGWRKERLMQVVGAAQFFEEIREVLALRESGQLGNVVEADVHQPADSGLS